MKLTRSRVFALVVVALAMALHAYEQKGADSVPSIGMFLWSMLPYGVCLIVFLASRSGVPAALGVSIALVLDLITHLGVFVNPRGPTDAIALLFVPLWSALLILPIMVLAWLAVRGFPK